jgi:protein-L-isoaspartate(D-aspartate) O-methyltransferase
MTDEFAAKRQAMVNEQLARRGIDNQRVLDAFARIERHRYVPAELHQLAYEDYPLAIGSAQTISQPYVVAYMLAALALQGTERVSETAPVLATRPPYWPNWWPKSTVLGFLRN